MRNVYNMLVRKKVTKYDFFKRSYICICMCINLIWIDAGKD